MKYGLKFYQILFVAVFYKEIKLPIEWVLSRKIQSKKR